MDVLDILLAKASSSDGQAASAAQSAQKAAQEAKAGADNAVTAVENVATIDILNTDTETEKVEEVSVTKNGTTKKAKFKAYKS